MESSVISRNRRVRSGVCIDGSRDTDYLLSLAVASLRRMTFRGATRVCANVTAIVESTDFTGEKKN